MNEKAASSRRGACLFQSVCSINSRPPTVATDNSGHTQTHSTVFFSFFTNSASMTAGTFAAKQRICPYRD